MYRAGMVVDVEDEEAKILIATGVAQEVVKRTSKKAAAKVAAIDHDEAETTAD